MALNEPKAKKKCKLKPSQKLPLPNRFNGTFNGFCVSIHEEEDMKKIISMGYFGKATLSRNYPQFQKESIIRNRVFQSRKLKADHRNKVQKVIVVPDSDSESEDYFTNLKPEFQFDYSGIQENVNLGLEEAFFLAAAVKCLDIYKDGSFLDLERAWELFKHSDKYFVENYLAYHYFRAKNWVVKPGIKFGGDFLLYKQGPPFFHASYVVIIHVVDENLKQIKNLSRRSMKNTFLMGLNRLCETSGKELLICEIIWPGILQNEEIKFEDVPKFAIKETIMKRWICSQERQT